MSMSSSEGFIYYTTNGVDPAQWGFQDSNSEIVLIAEDDDGHFTLIKNTLRREGISHRIIRFVLLDEFRSDSPDDYIAGFPNHPHRGFETVTYILAGRMRH